MLRRSPLLCAALAAAVLGACRTDAPEVPPARDAELRLNRDRTYGEVSGLQYEGVHADHPAALALARLAASERGPAIETIARRIGLDGSTAGEILLAGVDAAVWNVPPIQAEERILEGRRRPVATISIGHLTTGRIAPETLLVEALCLGQVLARRGEDYFLLPPWFRAGIALYASDRGPAVMDSRLAELLPSSQPPASLVRGLEFESPGGWDLSGWLAFRFMESEFGPAGVKDFVRVVVEEGVDVENAFAVSLGLSSQAFRQRFLAHATETLERRGEPATSAYRAAVALDKAGRRDEALAALRALAEAPEPSFATGNARYRIGLVRVEEGAWEAALAEFDAVVSSHGTICPLIDLAAQWRAECLLGLDRVREAIVALEEYLRDYPGSYREPRARLVLGEAWLAAGDPVRSREAYLSHRARCPQDDGRFAVALALGRIASDAGEFGLAREEFARAAAAPDAPVAAAARTGLASLDAIESGEPPPEVVERLRAWVAEFVAEASPQAAERLVRVGRFAIPYLGEALATAGVPARANLVRVLARIGDPGAARHLMAALRTDVLEVQLACLSGLLDLQIEPDSLVTLVEAAGRDMEPEARASLSTELDRLFFHSTPELRRRIPRLVERLRSPRSEDRLGVLLDLNRLQAAEGVPVLVHLLNDRDPPIRHKALLACNLWGDVRARPGLLACLGGDDPADRALAVHLIGRFPVAETFADLRRALEDAHAGVRQAAIAAILELDDPRRVEVLLRATRDADYRVANAAEAGLATLPPRQVVPAVLAELRRPGNPEPRQIVLFRIFERASGNPIVYDPKASPEEKVRLVQSLESWWNETSRREDR